MPLFVTFPRSGAPFRALPAPPVWCNAPPKRQPARIRESRMISHTILKTSTASLARALGPFALAAATAYGLPAAADPIPPGGHPISKSSASPGSTASRAPSSSPSSMRRTITGISTPGHSFDQGWSIVDVTDPKNPRYVKFIPYADAGEGRAHRAGDAARRHPDHRDRQEIEDGSDADRLGHQRSREPEEDRPMERRRGRLAPQFLSRRQVRLSRGLRARLSRQRP